MSCFHHQYYRYVRMMLRRYPKMRNESFATRDNHGTRAICGRRDMDKHVDFLRTLAQVHFLRYQRPLFDGEASMLEKTRKALTTRSKSQ